MSKAENTKYLKLWNQYRENTSRATPVDLNESPSDKKKRIKRLENNPEEWFKYYFPNYYKSEPAPFHIKATKRVLNNPEYYEVRSWSRELAKSVRTMMEVLYLTTTGKKKTVLMVSATKDDAERLLLPYKVNLETNHRLINDYGDQQSLGNWEAEEFKTKKGVSFRAIGAGQSPRGTRNEADRPDIILIDDIDTDEECRNKERIKKKYDWISGALYGCRSISEPLLWIANGNIIAKYCCITEMAKVADTHEITNIRDKDGKSTWPAKNTVEFIERALSKQPWSAQQKEYYNNPVTKGDVFEEITYGKCPPLKFCDQVEIYADPSTSNKDRGSNKQASYKSVGVIGRKGRKYYVYKVWLLQTSNSKFISWLYEAYLYCKDKGVDTLRVSIENNPLQDPHYQQVLLPLIYQMAETFDFTLPVTEDKRKKPDKFFRIEGTLEPMNRLGNLIFNIAEKKDPHMVRMEDQMLGVSSTATVMDGPDMLEGGSWRLQHNQIQKTTSYSHQARESRRY